MARRTGHDDPPVEGDLGDLELAGAGGGDVAERVSRPLDPTELECRARLDVERAACCKPFSPWCDDCSTQTLDSGPGGK